MMTQSIHHITSCSEVEATDKELVIALLVNSSNQVHTRQFVAAVVILIFQQFLFK